MAVGNVLYTPKKALTQADVVDSLLSTVPDLPLSAAQGNCLNGRITEMFTAKSAKNTDTALNLDDYTEPGFSDVLFGGYNLNAPPIFINQQAFYLMVLKYGGTVKQITVGYDTGFIATRHKYIGVWSSWEEIARKSDLNAAHHINSGDILETAKTFATGFTAFITGGPSVTNLPHVNCQYSYGYSLHSTGGIHNVCIFERYSGAMYINPYYDGYKGWKKIEATSV